MILRLFVLLLLATSARADLQIGDPARPLDLPGLDGKLTRIEDLRGRVTAVDFFATWCGPCHLALAALEQLAQNEPRLQLVIVDVGEDPEIVKAFFAGKKLKVLIDRKGEAARRWGQRRFPTTFVVDAAGLVRHINRGYGSGYPERLRGWIRGLL